MNDPTIWLEVVGFVLGGGSVGALGTYLGVRKKTQSELEIAYMSQLSRMSDRIENLETREGKHWEELRTSVRQEREDCDRRIEEIERRFEEDMRQLRNRFEELSEPIDDG